MGTSHSELILAVLRGNATVCCSLPGFRRHPKATWPASNMAGQHSKQSVVADMHLALQVCAALSTEHPTEQLNAGSHTCQPAPPRTADCCLPRCLLTDLHHPRWLMYIHRGVCLRPILGRAPPVIRTPLPQHSLCSTDRSRAAAAIAATLLLPAASAAAPCAEEAWRSRPCCRPAARLSTAAAAAVSVSLGESPEVPA